MKKLLVSFALAMLAVATAYGQGHDRNLVRQQPESSRNETLQERKGELPRAGGASGFSAPTSFVARAVVVNSTEKTIKAVSWETVLTDPVSKQELKRYETRSEQEILPGRTSVLTKRLRIPSQPNSTRSTLANYRSEIKRIEYLDGTVWERN